MATVLESGLNNELRFRKGKEAAPAGDYVPVDSQKHAESMGAVAIYATTSSEVKVALERARKADRITVIVIPVDPESRMPGLGNWWDEPVAEVSSADRTKSTRVKYEEATKKQRPVLS